MREEPEANADVSSAHGPVPLDARDVRCVLGGTVAVDGVNLHVAAGKCVALIGESGAGKTTLLRCFNRMVVPAAGTVTVNGTDVTRQPPAALRRRIGYVPQHGGLLPVVLGLAHAQVGS